MTFSSHVADQKGQIKWVDQRHVRLPKVRVIAMAEALPEAGWVKEVHCDGRDLPEAPGAREIVGVDVGVKTLAVTSSGDAYENPRPYAETERKLRRVNKAIARSIKLNPNVRTKRRKRLCGPRARLQARQSNQRRTHHRQVASAIAKSAGVVVVKSLNVSGLMRNRRLAKALSDAGMGGFLAELDWQCAKRGVRLVKAGRMFPSTQLCARCGERPDERIDLSVRPIAASIVTGRATEITMLP